MKAAIYAFIRFRLIKPVAAVHGLQGLISAAGGGS